MKLPITYKPVELRNEEPRQPNEAYKGLLGAIGPSHSIVGLESQTGLIGETWFPFPRLQMVHMR